MLRLSRPGSVSFRIQEQGQAQTSQGQGTEALPSDDPKGKKVMESQLKKKVTLVDIRI